MLNIAELLQPVSAERPCGEDLSYSAEMDRIAQARLEDDPALDQGVWVTALRQADWPLVVRQCSTLIATRSKDLRLAVWLAEALARTEGPRGLGDGCAVLAGLCEQFWDALYPLADDDDYEQRNGNLRWLLSRMPELLRQWQQSHGAAPPSEVQHCATMLAQLEQACDRRLGGEGPGFSGAREALQTLSVLAQVDDAKMPLPVVGQDATPAMPVISAGPICNRQQALGELRRVAVYFRTTEPHSPVAYLAEKAAYWGEMPLHNWLKEVVKDSGQLAQLENLLGVTSTD